MNIRKGLTGLAIAMLAVTAMLTTTVAPASAAKLCKNNEAVCKAENTYAGGTTYEGTATNTKFFLEPMIGGMFVKVTVLCAEAGMFGQTLAKEGEPLPGKIELMIFEGCETAEKAACEVWAVEQPYFGGFIPSGAGGGAYFPEVEFRIECKKPEINCRYRHPEAPLIFFGGNPAAIEAKEITLDRVIMAGEKNCPSVMKWWGKYTLGTPKPVYLTG